ncbi:MAG: efflux RND transporter periplasmic adaptor subunit [Patescibacteria group bacterium]
MIQKIGTAITNHKITTGLIIIILLGGGYFGYNKFFKKDNSQTYYVLAAVEKGTLVTSISGSGQVAVSNQVDLPAKASGDLLYLNMAAGQKVTAGTTLARIDSSDVQKTIRDALASLESAKISMQKLQTPVDELSLMQSQNALINAQETKERATEDLAKTYEDGFNAVANAFLDLPTIMTGLNDILYGNAINHSQDNIDYYSDSAERYDEQVTTYKSGTNQNYQMAKAAYDQNAEDYKLTTRLSTNKEIEDLIIQTYETTKKMAEVVKSANNLIQFYKKTLTEHSITPQTLADTHLTSLSSYTSKTNSHLSTLLSSQNSIRDDKDTIVDAERTIIEKTASLADLKSGTDELDLKSAELSIQQKENSLADAREKLADYTVRAPFEGTIAKVNVEKGDSVSSGTALGTLITDQRIAEISLNEIDAAQVEVGQKATLTFDAISDLTLTGQVAETDTLGTVSSGVVTYTVKIVFDTQDERVKPGMTVTASIMTDSRPDVLLVANSAIKTANGESYVEMPDEDLSSNTEATNSNGILLSASPRQQIIQTGLTDDSMTEVLDGLTEGDLVVIKTIVTTITSSTTSSAKSLLQFGPGQNRNSSTNSSTTSNKSTSTSGGGGMPPNGGMPPM